MKKKLLVRDKYPSLSARIGAAAILTAYVGALGYLFWNFKELQAKRAVQIIMYAIIIFPFIWNIVHPLVAVHKIYFNSEENKIKRGLEIGFFNFNWKWTEIKNLEYVSVFHVGPSNYAINLWHNETDIINLFNMQDEEKALKMGLEIADRMDTDLLDATERGYHKWVDKQKTLETGETFYQ